MEAAVADRAAEDSEQVLRLIERFIDTANAGDLEAHASTFHFPHVLINNGAVSIWNTLDELRSGYLPKLMALRERGLARSVFDTKEIVQRDDNTFHVAVQFTRYDHAQIPLGTYRALYIVTRIDGRWGILARSNFVPPAAS